MVGLIARIGGLPWTVSQELRLGVQAFAASGKPTVAWADSYGEGNEDLAAYVLATAFDEIWLQPTGSVGALGVGIETTFLRGAFDKVGIEPQFEQRYEYKNAADRFTRTEFTPPHRESLERLASSIFTDAVASIAASRDLVPRAGPRAHRRRPAHRHRGAGGGSGRPAGLPRRGLRRATFSVSPTRPTCCSPTGGTGAGDRRCRPGGGNTSLWSTSGAPSSPVERAADPSAGRPAATPSAPSCGRWPRATTSRRVVLRVDSPGGSAVASDAIWREVGRVRETGKPVVVSMGEVAASGGYYIACSADADRGVAGHADGLDRRSRRQVRAGGSAGAAGTQHRDGAGGAHALMFSPRRRFSAAERERLAATIDAIYDDFVAKVAAGRRRPLADIEAVARGRVWTGRDAVEVGLVDHLGGLRDAVQIARRWRICPRTLRSPAPCTCHPWPDSDRPRTARIRGRSSVTGRT